MMCQSAPRLGSPATAVALSPYINQTAGVPLLPCHRMSELPSDSGLRRPSRTRLKAVMNPDGGECRAVRSGRIERRFDGLQVGMTKEADMTSGSNAVYVFALPQ